MGSIFRVPFFYAENLAEPVSEIKKDGVTVYAADVSGARITDERIEERRAFIIGNEANGISEDVIKLADRMVSIPMSGKVESLNAAVSAAILMFRF